VPSIKSSSKAALHSLISAASATMAQAEKALFPVAGDPFKPDMGLLKQNRWPDKSRNAESGIGSHWGSQAVPQSA
jgi:hypothetical protein